MIFVMESIALQLEPAEKALIGWVLAALLVALVIVL